MSEKKTEKPNRTSIGGQAVIEGVMMRGESSMATSVRDENGIIRTETKRLKPKEKTAKILKFPLIRGVVSFLSSLITGTQILMRSAEVFGEGEPSNFEKWLAKTLKIDVMKVITFISLVLGLGLAVFLFMWLPQFTREMLEKWFNTTFGLWEKNFIEGGLKLLIFILYILLSSLLKDVKRTFMYHGAEHKTISCYEKGLELTVENAKKCPRVHDRCGTTFMVFVILISILGFACLESAIGENIDSVYRILLKIALLPVVAGVSYELLKALSKTNFFLFYPLKVPGLLLQLITTKEPDEQMLEVAIKSFKTVMDLEQNPELEERTFDTYIRAEVVNDVINRLKINGIEEIAEAEWIVSLSLGVKRDELYSLEKVSQEEIDKINKIVAERITGRPLWYCVGDTEFYGYTIKVDERVLIPRPETELLVENALKYIDEKKTVLDLCTGSGAIAISVNKQSGAKVVAVDKSLQALEVAKENAILNQADVEFIESDMFNSLKGRKFDVIISNPPYIKSSDILKLQSEVKNFEPKMALDGGESGYDFYQIIADNALDYLNDNGVLLMECGIGQAQEIAKLLKGFASVEIIKDYEDIDRIVKAVRNV